LSHDPLLHQHCLSYIAGVYEMTVLMGEVNELLNEPGRRLRHVAGIERERFTKRGPH
jgi:hypothetical protein